MVLLRAAESISEELKAPGAGPGQLLGPGSTDSLRDPGHVASPLRAAPQRVSTDGLYRVSSLQKELVEHRVTL